MYSQCSNVLDSCIYFLFKNNKLAKFYKIDELDKFMRSPSSLELRIQNLLNFYPELIIKIF